MFRKTISFLFLVLVLYNATSAVWINAAFLLNRGYVAENLCQQRFISGNACQGQCVLMKKLRESQEKDSKPTTAKMQELQLVFIQSMWSLDMGTTCILRTESPVPRNESRYAHPFASSIFHPPLG